MLSSHLLGPSFVTRPDKSARSLQYVQTGKGEDRAAEREFRRNRVEQRR
jgi:hypothetical protein